MIWLLLGLVAAMAFVAGWAMGVWLCSKRRWCPLYMQRALYEWKVTLEAEQQKRNEEKKGAP